MYEIFEQLLQKFGVTTADVCKATGIGQSTMSNWKNRRNLISGKNAQLIADYFGVSIDYLMTGTETEQKETKTKPGINIVDKNGESKTFDINSVIYSIMQSVVNMPLEKQEMVNDMVGGNNKKKKVIYVENPYDKKISKDKNSGSNIDEHFTNVDEALAYIQQEAALVAAFDANTEKDEVIIQMANAMYMNRNKK
jgi:transcriptional regulator with XRE-family HTH domain